MRTQVFDASSTDDHALATTTFKPALAPAVNSIFIIGVSGTAATATDKVRVVTLIDAPELSGY
jgi:hypothetical protein